MRRTIRLSGTILLLGVAALAQGPGGPPPGGGASGDGIWTRNAAYGEAVTFDACFGHQPQNGEYHHHVQPVCLRAQLDDNLEVAAVTRVGTVYREKTSGLTHSPILGWAFDGYPIYGPYGYSDPKDAKSAVRRMRTGFRLRRITDRTSLPAWAVALNPSRATLTSSQYGPAINAEFPLGRYAEDHEWAEGVGDLDQYNGRFEVTPEFPNGTYAYHVTIDESGAPVFPFIVGPTYYGARVGGQVRGQVPASAQDYFRDGALVNTKSDVPVVALWMTKNSANDALVVSGADPTQGPKNTWPGTLPTGLRASTTAVTSPVKVDVQRVRLTESSVYVTNTGLPSYTTGPWFGPLDGGGVFQNWPTAQNAIMEVTRNPQAAATRTATGLGAIGVWVNGIPVFNALDGASYSNASGADAGGGGVAQAALISSAASLELGPQAPGALVSAYSMFGAVLATSTETAASGKWPTTLGGSTVTVRDSAGATFPAEITYASPSQVNFRVPTGMAAGGATVTIGVGGRQIQGRLNILDAYPGLFMLNSSRLAAAQVVRVRGTQQSYEPVYSTGPGGSLVAAPIRSAAAGEQVYLALYATGLGSAKDVAASVGGVKADVSYAGPQGEFGGLDQVNILLPASVAGKGRVDVSITAGGRVSNAVNVMVQ